MFIATLVIGIILGALLLFSAYGKLTRNAEQVKTITDVGFPPNYIWALALCEIAGALGVLIGLYWYPIGVAAAIGVILYFVFAVAAHLRVREYAVQAAAMMLALGLIYLVLRLLAV
ncbi:membrane protein [Mycobacterium saskatchewanense]|uniref:DoxX family protein n=1 Tax=Mycobacterium saskatchewanense TaxID=220927 RepID=A0AAJ3TWD9_9MYCO|nr:DoxX family protein [Mycobacterium saskatchewanense]ORW73714.1 hypothetical protein AWC23_06425 [Mycobacterium saskatchewanense]BBX65176.1 membrane protein [Mycobacterium saskatchewanense]